MPSEPVSSLPSDATPVSFPPFDAAPVFSPSQQCPPGPSSPRLLSGTAPFLLPSTVPLSPVSSPFSSTLPPLPGMCSPGASSDSSTPALSRHPFGSPASALSGPQHLPPFRHRSAKQDRMEGLCLAKIGPNRGPSFGPVWPNGARREGALGAGAGKPRRNAGRKHVSKSRGRVLRKRKETGGRGAVPERGKRMVSKRRCIGGGGGVGEREKRIV